MGAEAFATVELGFDLLFLFGEYFSLDLESTWILICVGQESLRDTYRPLPLGAGQDLGRAEPGSISRRMVADKTGLPRETVRRKINELIANRYLIAVGHDRVRMPFEHFENERMRACARAVHDAVTRYQSRITVLERASA